MRRAGGRARSFALATALAAAAVASATAATSSTVVTAEVPSATTLANGCTGAGATQLGPVLPSAGARTSTGADVCRITFGSSNATAQLRIAQADGEGAAMALGLEPPTLQGRGNAPGRTLAVFGYDASLAWAAGRAQTIYRTSDGGGTWSEFSTPSGSNTDVEAVPGQPDVWWVVGEGRRIWRTADGQAATPTWTDQSTALASAGWPSTVNINAIAIPDADTIVIVGNSRWIGVYDISAATWTAFQHADTSTGNLVSVDALDANTFIAAGDNARVLMTTTKGLNSASWSVTPFSTVIEPNGVAWGSATRAYMVGEDGYLAAWDGSAWQDRSAQLASTLDLYSVDVLPGSPDTVMAVDESGGIYRSTDAGVTWTHRTSGSTSRAFGIHATTSTRVFTSGGERSLARSGDGGLSFTAWGPMGSEALTDVAASPVDGRRLVAVGDGAWRTSDAGATWTRASVGSAVLDAVSLASDGDGWAVGAGGTILRTEDLGATWTAQSVPSGATEDLTSVAALDDYRVVAVGHGGRILRSRNAGHTWDVASSGTTHQLAGVDGVGDTVIAVGARGTVLRSGDAGATWTAITGAALPDPLLNLVDVDMVSEAEGYVAVSWDDVWRTTDGGLTWTQVAGGTATRNRAVAAFGSSVVTVGDSGSLARSTDRGATFSRTTGPAGTLPLAGAAAIDPHRVVTVGADAIRYRFDAVASATAQVADWTASTNDWDSGGFFGVCLQAVGGGATADWTVDAANVAGTCEALDSDPWRAVPATTGTGLAAHTTAAGNGTVDLVWGFRAKADQAPGSYEAGVVFEAIAP